MALVAYAQNAVLASVDRLNGDNDVAHPTRVPGAARSPALRQLPTVRKQAPLQNPMAVCHLYRHVIQHEATQIAALRRSGVWEGG